MPSRFETLLLGIAGGALAVSYLGAWRVVIVAVLVAAGSYAWRNYLRPLVVRE